MATLNNILDDYRLPSLEDRLNSIDWALFRKREPEWADLFDVMHYTLPPSHVPNNDYSHTTAMFTR